MRLAREGAEEGKVALAFEDWEAQHVGSVIVEPRPTLLRCSEEELRSMMEEARK